MRMIYFVGIVYISKTPQFKINSKKEEKVQTKCKENKEKQIKKIERKKKYKK